LNAFYDIERLEQFKDLNMKFSAIFLACLFSTMLCSAQLKGFSVGPYVEMAWPTGDFNLSNKNGIGGGVTADIRLGKLGLTGSAGILHFGGKVLEHTETQAEKMPSLTALPVRVGLKYRIVPLFYVKMEAGTSNYTGGESNALILSPGFGLRLLGLDVQFKYENWNGEEVRNMWGLRAGYNF
jgi:hypothetical protein